MLGFTGRLETARVTRVDQTGAWGLMEDIDSGVIIFWHKGEHGVITDPDAGEGWPEVVLPPQEVGVETPRVDSIIRYLLSEVNGHKVSAALWVTQTEYMTAIRLGRARAARLDQVKINSHLLLSTDN